MPKDSFIREKLTKELAMDRDCNRSYTTRMHRDAKEALVGLTTLLVFGIALVVWPSLGAYRCRSNPTRSNLKPLLGVLISSCRDF
jgi:hypothetical protein